MLLATTMAVAVAAAGAPPGGAGLTAALLRDRKVASCAREATGDAAAYARGAFQRREMALPGGRRAVVALAVDPCLALGQSTRIMIFVRAGAGYHRVLSSVVVPGLERIDSDGTVTLPTHETMEIMYEAVYVWDGKTFVAAPLRSTLYDVALGQRWKYEEAIRFEPGATSIVLHGTTAFNVGHTYLFSARAGQHATVALLQRSSPAQAVALYYAEDTSAVGALHGENSWSGVLPKSGRYELLVLGTDAAHVERTSPYELQLKIR
jgi:hypothetical protein